jgi:tetratricopeptide (TPR) repeat protein
MSEKTPSCPDGIEVVPFGKDAWRFRYPRIDGEIQGAFYEILEEWRYGAPFDHVVSRLNEFIAEYPEHIDARHHLAIVLGQMGRTDEADDRWEETVAMTLACMPDAFTMGEDQVPWFELANRPFLRAYYGLALSLGNRGEVRRAYRMFQNVIAMNPSDNQGARAMAVDAAFYLEDPEGALAVCEQYPDGILPEVLYGRVLAHYQLDHIDEAEAALDKALDILPKVAQELVKLRHTKPDTFKEDRITVGGDDEAYHYWIDSGPYWEGTPGAIEWLRDHLDEAVT